MIRLLLALGVTLGPAPETLIVAGPGGEIRIPVTADARAGPLVPAGPLLSALGGSASSDGLWVDVRLGAEPFRFLLGAPVLIREGKIYPLAAPARAVRDSLFLPLQFVGEALPRLQSQRFRYDPVRVRLTDLGRPVPVASVPPAATAPPASAAAPARRTRTVTIDPGHGGVDPGNRGRYLPVGVNEKHVTLQIGLLLRNELQRRGVEVVMTRTRDTLIDLRHRGRYCSDDCDLFVSLHVNSLERRAGYTAVRGFETFIMAEARTEDAARVARMENEAIRFETPSEDAAPEGIEFILKDLAMNEYLREAARAAGLVQAALAGVHDGSNRGVKQGPFMVLNSARRPAILVELGFGTNPEDGKLLSQPAGQKRLATALADAIIRYLDEFGRRSGEDLQTGAGRGGR